MIQIKAGLRLSVQFLRMGRGWEGMANAVAEELLVRCNQAREKGSDFPTIWNRVVRGHPLVLGLPIQVMVGLEPQLKIQLITGQNLSFRAGRFHLD